MIGISCFRGLADADFFVVGFQFITTDRHSKHDHDYNLNQGYNPEIEASGKYVM